MNQPAGRQQAILRPTEAARRIVVGRHAPPGELASWVDYLWWVRWDTEAPHRQGVVPAPVVHLSVEQWEGVPRVVVTGVQSRRFDQWLEGRGFAVAAAFRPACFRPFLDRRVADLADTRAPAWDVLGADDTEVAAAVMARGEPDRQALELLAGWVSALSHDPDPLCDDLAAVVERAEKDPSLTRADQLADLAGVSLRTLQRRFAEYVGVGPKWVVQRFRLLDAAAAAHSGEPVDWARLAADLGYSDQAHLVRTFTAMVGEPPAGYTRSGVTPKAEIPAGQGRSPH